MPLQASTILLRAHQRRAALDPSQPPISHDQVQHGKLATLLTEEDYNLCTMEILYVLFLLFTLKVTSRTIFSFSFCLIFLFMPMAPFLLSDFCLWFSPTFSYGLLCTVLDILCKIL